MKDIEYWVTFNITPSLEEMMVDSLLLLESDHGFTSFPVQGFNIGFYPLLKMAFFENKR